MFTLRFTATSTGCTRQCWLLIVNVREDVHAAVTVHQLMAIPTSMMMALGQERTEAFKHEAFACCQGKQRCRGGKKKVEETRAEMWAILFPQSSGGLPETGSGLKVGVVVEH